MNLCPLGFLFNDLFADSACTAIEIDFFADCYSLGDLVSESDLGKH